MFPIHEFEARFREILDELDALDGGEALEELNAEFEDALFMLSQTDLSGEDWRDELMDAMEEFEALAADYRRVEGAEALGERLEMVSKLARGSLEGSREP